MDIKRKPRGDKIYRGAYSYFKGDKLYAEEEFEVYKDRKELGMSFFATLHARVATGELLNIYLDYSLTKDYTPQKLLIEKDIGQESVTEIFDFNPRKNGVDYIFINKAGQEHFQITVPPKFGITTPTTSTSMLFLKYKKEDTTAKNHYQVLSSSNQWVFEKEPYMQNIVAERAALSAENFSIDGQSVAATPYRIWDASDIEDINDAAHVNHVSVQLSKYASIPYQVKSQDGTRIQIKYLNDLDKD
ncbi:MAG: hypothetical protein CME63_17185 [Halobacteriovoraceae bacterium]|nr:hypothetical protein [Halobacteriovoraceae bacterium]MBC99481.1 hypothetical protein [Halobacteriovoraceae bacterium]|tara:strand:- start:229326 stop:230060 length:735 start_codon:yes stop_codon:yes gene_type:complete